MAYEDVILASSPWGYWRGQITGPSVLDSSGNGRDMTVNGAVTNDTGIIPDNAGTCLVFTGADTDYLLRGPIAHMSLGNTPTTWEFWIIDDPENDNYDGCPVSITATAGTDGTGFCVYSVSDLSMWVTGAKYAQGPDCRSNTLRHIVAVCEPSAAATERTKIYINGNLYDTGAGASSLVVSTGTQRSSIGMRTTTGLMTTGSAVKGKMQEIALYDSALSAEQVAQHYAAGLFDSAFPAIPTATRMISPGVCRIFFSKYMEGIGTHTNFTIATLTVTAASAALDGLSADITFTGYAAATSYIITCGAGITDVMGGALTTATIAFATLNSGAQYLPSADTVTINNTAIDSTAIAARVVGAPEIAAAVVVPDEYSMRAYNTNLSQFVYWIAYTTPDFTGSQSIYPTIDLTDIVLLKGPAC